MNTEHVVQVTGLLPDTRYFYSIGNANLILQSGSDNFFRTAPLASTSRRLAFSVFGDCGRDQNSFRTLSLRSYLNNTTSNRADLMLLLGDNAYNSGTDAEYQAEFFTPYGSSILKNHVLFPAPGNHDYGDNGGFFQGDNVLPYYNHFTVPTNGECGGVASGSKAYYSYNWGNVHFLSLDSYGKETVSQFKLYDTASPQVQWIKRDLAANTRPWVVAYWHHPPYTMGSHNSDTEFDLVSLRQNLLTILERYGVDLVMCGHSHNYERSYLIRNHYGFESSFSEANNAVSLSSAKYDGSANSCPYIVTNQKEKHGTVYVVSGSAGADGGVQGSFPHAAMPYSIDDGGMFYFEVEGNRLDAKFLHINGTVADKFTIMKSVGNNTAQTINAGSSVTLTASWLGTYQWSNGATTRSITVSPTVNTTYSVTDGSSCLSDQFVVNVLSGPGFQNQMAATDETGKIKAYPIPVKRGSNLNINLPVSSVSQVELVSANGGIIGTYKLRGLSVIRTSNLVPGMYTLKIWNNNNLAIKKIIVN
jgi:3',5'-cyclic AMP phosphodiesterase CpdA